MNQKLFQTFNSAKKSIREYPFMLASALIVAISVIILIKNDSENYFWLVKLAFTAGLGVSLYFALAMLGQRQGKTWIGNSVGIVFLGVFYFLILPQDQTSFTEKYVYILIPIFFLSHIAVSIAPYFTNQSDEENFWNYNKTLFINTFLTVVFTQILSGGVLLALLAIEHLFGIKWPQDLYAQVFLGFMILGSAFIFTLFHGDGLEKIEKPSPYPVVIQFFTQFILIPLLFVYVCILYLYSLKILIEWQIPSGWVSYLVLAYAVLGILALLLVHPLLGSAASKSWVNWFRNIFYFTLFPLLILLFTAIGLRIAQYGFTEARYYVLLMAIWLSGITLYYIISKKPILKWIPITLFLVGCVSLLVPYFNPLSVGLRSQKHQITKILNETQLLNNGKIDFSKEVSIQVVDELQSKFRYLKSRSQERFFETKMDSAEYTNLVTQKNLFHTLFKQIKYDQQSSESNSIRFTANPKNAMDIEGYTYLISLNYEISKTIKIGSDSLNVNFSPYETTQKYSIQLNTDSLNLITHIEQWTDQYRNERSPKEIERIEIPFTLGAYDGKLFCQHLTINLDPNSGSKTFYLDPTWLVLKRKEGFRE